MGSREPFRLLQTCVGIELGLVLASTLRKSGWFDYYIVGTDSKKSVPAARYVDCFETVPCGNAEGYTDAILSLIKKHSIEAVLPGSDKEALALASVKAELISLGCSLFVSDRDCLEVITNKRITYEKLKSAGIRVPEYTVTDSIDACRVALSAFGYPKSNVVVKPVDGQGGRGVIIFYNSKSPPYEIIGGREKLIHNASLDDRDLFLLVGDGERLVMPYLSAPAYDVDVFAEAGLVKGIVVRRRTNPGGIPFKGNTIISDPKIFNYCADISKVLGLNGLHDFDLMTGSEGPVLLEVNPRGSDSIVASIIAGFPIIDSAIAASKGFNIPIDLPAQEIKVVDFKAVIGV